MNRTQYEYYCIEGSLRSALVTMALTARALERDGDEHGLAGNLNNEIAQGKAALRIYEVESPYCTCNGEESADEEELAANKCKCCGGQLV